MENLNTKTHYLKIKPRYFDDIILNHKRFEVRKNDRDYNVGDLLILREFDKYGDYTGRDIHARIVYILDSFTPILDYVVLGLDYIIFYPDAEFSNVSCFVL